MNNARKILSGICLTTFLSVTVVGSAFATSANQSVGTISTAVANETAIKDAGLALSDVTIQKSQLDHDDGTVKYEVDFSTGTASYEYDLNATTGAILKKSVEFFHTPVSRNASSFIGIEAGKKKALEDAGLSAADVTFQKQETDYDDGHNHYEIDFVAGTMKYEYEVKASTGEIVKKTVEVLPAAQAGNTGNTSTSGGSSNTNADGTITMDRAKEIATAHAGFTPSAVTFSKTELDRDDGRLVYEIEFRINRLEYEYQIDANTGRILDWEIDD